MYFIGFDIGGSSVKAALVSKNKIIGTRYERLPDNFGDLIEVVTGIKNDFVLTNRSMSIAGIGFSIAGALDKKREKMLLSYNILYLSGKNLQKIFEKKLAPYPVKIERDAYCFLLADSKIGKGRKYKYIFYLTLGTGIGGAFMINGDMITGYHGSAGEVGHTIVNLEGKTHWEDVGANKFIQGELGIRFSEARQRAGRGDRRAARVFKVLGENIGVGIANIINSFDPEAVIISGGLASAKELIFPGIKNGIEKYVISEEARKTRIIFSRLGRFGGALGAVLLFET